MSDTLCIENGLSIVENSKPHGKSYDQWLGDQAKPSHRELLRAAIDNIAADPDILSRHAKVASASRKAITGAGLNLYLHSGYSSTVTVFEVPEGTTAEAILEGVKKDYNIMLAGSFDVLAGKVIRIGHMGNNATFYNVREVFAALDGTLRRLGVPLKASMEDIFCKNMQ